MSHPDDDFLDDALSVEGADTVEGVMPKAGLYFFAPVPKAVFEAMTEAAHAAEFCGMPVVFEGAPGGEILPGEFAELETLLGRLPTANEAMTWKNVMLADMAER
jgi:hypothetical protein